MINLINI